MTLGSPTRMPGGNDPIMSSTSTHFGGGGVGGGGGEVYERRRVGDWREEKDLGASIDA